MTRRAATLLLLLLTLLPAVAQRRKAAPPVTFAEVVAAYDSLDVALATTRLESYAKQKDADAARVDSMRTRLTLATNMLERVEKVVVVDSLAVPTDDFFSYYRLSRSAGRLLPGFPAAIHYDLQPQPPVYVTEDATLALWADSDTLYQGRATADGAFEAPVALGTRAMLFADGLPGRVATPFLMPDGVTLYFAADGPASLGGLDIFIARRDGEDTFLQPSNVGMPYNSPANDYMMAIDEETGLGWWATDRNASPGMVTIYTFVPSDLRVNYPADTPDIAALALLTDYSLTHTPDTDVNALLARLDDPAVMGDVATPTPDFLLPLPDGRMLTRLADITDVDVRQLAAQWHEQSRQLELYERRLEGMRARYAAGEHIVAEAILEAETELPRRRRALLALQNRLITALTQQ